LIIGLCNFPLAFAYLVQRSFAFALFSVGNSFGSHLSAFVSHLFLEVT